MKFLVDECLSEELTKAAQSQGHLDASHVRWIGKSGAKDWELLPIILAEDWVFVTKNAYDFRGPPDAPGTKGEYAKAELHAGLVCLSGPPGMDLDLQLDLFQAAMQELQRDPDLVNQVLEVSAATLDAAEFTIRRYALPEE
jgi:hypothetical protein